ncbi:MAG TPA: CHAT domain-containing protein [Anaerolineae bacterium]|nr:CHAT domain-containing protein [Anaerolineae bacterium]HIP72117.1 CHAT domain-containing protein [Anaerolineae bacterium]
MIDYARINALSKILNESLSENSDLESIALALGENPNNVIRDGAILRTNAQDMSMYFARRGRLDDLIAATHDLYPHIDLTSAGGPAAEKKSYQPQKKTSQPATEQPADSGKPAEAIQYENFDITIGLKRSDGTYPISASSPAGEAASILQELPLDDEQFNDVIYYLKELIAQTEDAEQFGEDLRRFLFPTPIQSLFDSSLATVKAQGKNGLRIRLKFSLDTSPELSQIPWEYCASSRTYLALNEETPVVRYIQTNVAPEATSVPDKVRILVVLSNPLGDLNVHAEELKIRSALAKVEKAGKVEIRVLDQATRLNLFDTFTEFDPHIFHYVGHGALNDDGEGTLILATETGEPEAVNAKRLLVLLQSSDVKLAILNACETAASDEGKAFMGVAPRLVWAGIPAVLAMQFSIPDSMAIAFMRSFYKALADGQPLDTAMTIARKGAYFVNDEIYWAIPVLFMRSPDGRIWS